MTSETFARVLDALEGAFSMELTTKQQSTWFAALAPLPDEAVFQGALSVCREWPHNRRPWATDLYQRARDFLPPAPPPIPQTALSRGSARTVIASFAETMGTAAPREGVMPVDDATTLLLEKVSADHEDWSIREVCIAAMAAMCGRGEYADLWRLYRGREAAP